MEAIKNAIGLGTTAQEGREPVSGVTGSGVGGEPYDQGNAEDSTLGGKAPQHTSSTTASNEPYTIGSGLGPNNTTTTTGTTTGLTSSDAVTPNAASATTTTGPAVEPTSSNVGSTNNGPHSSNVANKVDPRVDSDNDKNTSSAVGSSGPIGGSSWMSTALPHRDGNSATTGKETNSASSAAVTGTTTQDFSHSYSKQTSTPPTGLEDIRSQPPNNLPTNVPSGTSTDFVAPGSSITGTTADPMHAHQDIPTETVGSGVGGDHQPSHALTGSRASVAPIDKPDHTNAPLKPAEKGGEHGVNPSAIPTAGGKKIGEDAYTERKSMQADVTDSTIAAPTTTSENTARNVGTAEAAGVPTSSATHENEGSSVTSGGSGSEHKEKKGLVEKIKEKVHIHKH